MQNLTLLTKQPRYFCFYPWACATSLIYKLPTHDHSQARQHFSSSLTGRPRFGITLLSHCDLGRWPSYIKRPPQRASSSSLSVETPLANSLSSNPSQVKQPRTTLRPSLQFFRLSISARTHIVNNRPRFTHLSCAFHTNNQARESTTPELPQVSWRSSHHILVPLPLPQTSYQAQRSQKSRSSNTTQLKAVFRSRNCHGSRCLQPWILEVA